MPANAAQPRPDTRVLVADDHTLVRQGLCELIASHPGLTVVGEAADGRAAVAAAAALRPDVVVMDVWLPKLSGVLAIAEIRRLDPKIRILMLSAYDGQGAVTDALRAGASGYLLKSAGADQLIAAIRAVRAGESYLTPALTGPLVGQAVRADEQAAGTGIRALTFREREVLQRLAEGLSAPEIATELHITRRTVETHRASVMRKLGIRKTAGLVRFAIREGLLPP
jgi:DNA-binding NarL/FixJ family response regulator